MKSVLRRVALSVPPVARLYNFALKQSESVTALTTQNAALTAELAEVAQERDSLELQLYVLRSDHQRAAVRNQDLSRALKGAEDRAAGITPNDLSQFYAKLSADIARLQPTSAADATLYLDLLERLLSQSNRDAQGNTQTPLSHARLRNLRDLAQRVVREAIPGDMLDAGVKPDGASILLRGVLKAHGNTKRSVWVMDSDPAQNPFDRYGLLDQQVKVLRQTPATTPINQLALLRLAGDTPSSTLEALYDKIAPGGYVIVDDDHPSPCRQAVDEFRRRRNIHEQLTNVDGVAVYWRKP